MRSAYIFVILLLVSSSPAYAVSIGDLGGVSDLWQKNKNKITDTVGGVLFVGSAAAVFVVFAGAAAVTLPVIVAASVIGGAAGLLYGKYEDDKAADEASPLLPPDVEANNAKKIYSKESKAAENKNSAVSLAIAQNINRLSEKEFVQDVAAGTLEVHVQLSNQIYGASVFQGTIYLVGLDVGNMPDYKVIKQIVLSVDGKNPYIIDFTKKNEYAELTNSYQRQYYIMKCDQDKVPQRWDTPAYEANSHPGYILSRDYAKLALGQHGGVRTPKIPFLVKIPETLKYENSMSAPDHVPDIAAKHNLSVKIVYEQSSYTLNHAVDIEYTKDAKGNNVAYTCDSYDYYSNSRFKPSVAGLSIPFSVEGAAIKLNGHDAYSSDNINDKELFEVSALEGGSISNLLISHLKLPRSFTAQDVISAQFSLTHPGPVFKAPFIKSDAAYSPDTLRDVSYSITLYREDKGSYKVVDKRTATFPALEVLDKQDFQITGLELDAPDVAKYLLVVRAQGVIEKGNSESYPVETKAVTFLYPHSRYKLQVADAQFVSAVNQAAKDNIISSVEADTLIRQMQDYGSEINQQSQELNIYKNSKNPGVMRVVKKAESVTAFMLKTNKDLQKLLSKGSASGASATKVKAYSSALYRAQLAYNAYLDSVKYYQLGDNGAGKTFEQKGDLEFTRAKSYVDQANPSLIDQITNKYGMGVIALIVIILALMALGVLKK